MAKWPCANKRICNKVVTDFELSVVPHFLYSRAVITDALRHRFNGQTWDRAAALCTTDGQVDPSDVKRWQRRFDVVEGGLVDGDDSDERGCAAIQRVELPLEAI